MRITLIQLSRNSTYEILIQCYFNCKILDFESFLLFYAVVLNIYVYLHYRNNKNRNIMARVTVKAVKDLVIKNNLSGKVSMDFENGNHLIKSEGGSLSFLDSITANKVYRILIHELFFDRPESFMDQDEFDGLCQASQLGFKPYECTILG